MGLKERYENSKQRMLFNEEVCEENRKLWRDFFEYEERKLKRKNGLSELDEGCYKTLSAYTYNLPTVNSWFKNKPWINLTEEDIRRVYDDLEDGKIKNANGEKFKDRSSFYNKIFKSKPFRMAGKEEMAKTVIEYCSLDDTV